MRCLDMLHAYGMTKLNLAGGEPLLYPELVHRLIRFAKEELQVVVSIVSNASQVNADWLAENKNYLDYFAISCDSANDSINATIGRRERNASESDHTEKVLQAAQWCHDLSIPLKLNTVVCIHNVHEDMTHFVRKVKPIRWKIFQVLLLQGENTGQSARRIANDLTVTSEQFQAYVDRHHCLQEEGIAIAPEPNDDMQNSYLLLDECLRLLNCANDGKEAGVPVMEIGAHEAVSRSGFDKAAFLRRGGNYYEKSMPTATCRSFSVAW